MNYGKKLLAVAIALMMLVLPASVMVTYADEKVNATNDPEYELEYMYGDEATGQGWWLGQSEAAVIGIKTDYSGLLHVIVPSSVEHNSKSYQVTWIGASWGAGAFNDCRNLESISLPGNLKGIGQSAFYGCTALKEIIIPNKVTEIQCNAFDHCTSLYSVEFTDGSVNLYLPGYVFQYCSSLTKVELPSRLAYNPSDSSKLRTPFVNCDNLTEMTMLSDEGDCFVKDNILFAKLDDDKLRIIEYLPTKTDETYDVPSDVTEIAQDAFLGASHLKTVNIHANVTEIAQGAFSDCTSLTVINVDSGNAKYETGSYGELLKKNHSGNGDKELYMFPGGYTGKYESDIKYIHLNAFSGCMVTEIVLNSLVELPTESYSPNANNSFSRCFALEKITLGTGITSIPPETFKDCVALKEVDAQGVTEIKSDAFNGCESLTLVKTPKVTSIGSNAFKGCTALDNGSGLNNVKTIGDGAFSGCRSLKSVLLSSVEMIGNNAFASCVALSSITITNNCTGIGSKAFSGCSSLATVTFMNTGRTGITIGDYAFEHCTSLKTVTLPSDLKRAVDEEGNPVLVIAPFFGCSALESISIDSTNTEYATEGGVLYNNGKTTIVQYPEGSKTKEFTIPDTVKKIARDTFRQCANLEKLTIGKGVDKIVAGSIVGCMSLKEIKVATGNTDYKHDDNGVLYSYNGEELIQYPCGKTDKSYTIPSGVKSIKLNAFAFCSHLEELTIANTVTDIELYSNSNPFYSCGALKTFKVEGDKSAGGFYVDKAGALCKLTADDKDTLISAPATTSAGNGQEFIIHDGIVEILASALCNSHFDKITVPKTVEIIHPDCLTEGTIIGCYFVTSTDNPIVDAFELIGRKFVGSKQVPNAYTFLAPELKMTSPKDGDTYSGWMPTINVKGTTDAERIEIHVTGASSKSIAIEDGKFDVSIQTSSIGGDIDVTVEAYCGDAVTTKKVTVVNAPPKIEIKSPTEGSTVNVPKVTVEGTVSGATSMYCCIDGGLPQAVTFGEGKFSVELDIPEANHKYEIKVYAQYMTYSTGEATVHVTYKPDTPTPAPALNITSPTAGSTVTTETISVKGTTDGAKVTIFVNGTSVGDATLTAGAFSKDVTLKAGSNTIKVVATGADGQTTEKSVTVTYSDTPTPAPTLTITSPKDGSTVTSGTVAVKGTTDGAKVTIFVNGTSVGDVTPTAGSFSKDVTLKAGSNTIKVVATGADGTTAEKSVTVTYSGSTPSSDSGFDYALLAAFVIAVLAVLYVALVSRD